VTVRLLLELVSLFCAGILAGAEVVVRLGVRAPIAVLDERPQIELRQALIRTLRVLVPSIYVSAAVSAVAAAVLDGAAPGLGFRLAGLLALVAWTLTTFVGTVPINQAVLAWQPDAPPDTWRALVRRWERLDTVRTVAAVLAFASFLTAVALRLA
jgi:uncharacterized membrane protein